MTGRINRDHGGNSDLLYLDHCGNFHRFDHCPRKRASPLSRGWMSDGKLWFKVVKCGGLQLPFTNENYEPDPTQERIWIPSMD